MGGLPGSFLGFNNSSDIDTQRFPFEIQITFRAELKMEIALTSTCIFSESVRSCEQKKNEIVRIKRKIHI